MCDKTSQKKKARAFAGGQVFQKNSHLHAPHHTTRYTIPHNTHHTQITQQSRTEAKRTEQNRTDHIPPEQNKIEQNGTEQNRPDDQNRIDQNRTE